MSNEKKINFEILKQETKNTTGSKKTKAKSKTELAKSTTESKKTNAKGKTELAKPTTKSKKADSKNGNKPKTSAKKTDVRKEKKINFDTFVDEKTISQTTETIVNKDSIEEKIDPIRIADNDVKKEDINQTAPKNEKSSKVNQAVVEEKRKKIREEIVNLESFYKLLVNYNKQLDNQVVSTEKETLKKTKIENKKITKKIKGVNLDIFQTIKRIQKLQKHYETVSLLPHEIIKVIGVNKYYSSKTFNTKILIDIDLSINEGELVVILGSSGSGKTSVLNLLSGIEQPTYGIVNIDGANTHLLNNKELTAFRKDHVGYIFQAYGLLPNLTVFENVAMGAFLGEQLGENKKRSVVSKEDEQKILDIIAKMEMTDHASKYPYELSGGQKQRTAIARVLAKNSKIIFADEPTAAVDEEMSEAIVDLFIKVNKEFKKTIVIVTHDERIAQRADKVIRVEDGKIFEIVDNNLNSKSKIDISVK